MGVKVVKDLVYSYIEIDEAVQKLIDTASFQRLKRIKQLFRGILQERLLLHISVLNFQNNCLYILWKFIPHLQCRWLWRQAL